MNTITVRLEKKDKWECAKCHRDITHDSTWVRDDTKDNTLYCYACATDDCIRLKDLS